MSAQALDAGVVLNPGRGDLGQQSGSLRLLLLGRVVVPQRIRQDLDPARLLQLHDALQNAADGPESSAKKMKTKLSLLSPDEWKKSLGRRLISPECIDSDFSQTWLDTDGEEGPDPAVLGYQPAEVVALQRQVDHWVDGGSQRD